MTNIASREVDALVLGGGLTGLAAGLALGDRAVVLEREDRPGGLVRSHHSDGWWFDHVLHMLYFRSPDTEQRILPLLGGVFEPCNPTAWVETGAGPARFPIQENVHDFDPAIAAACLHDLARANFEDQPKPQHYADLLRNTFGDTLFRLFFEPYNLKMWRRPLDRLAPSGFQWNLRPPDFKALLARALGAGGEPEPAYNAHGTYPRPPPDAPVRGMEFLSQALAAHVPGLHLNETVVSIDPAQRTVVSQSGERLTRWQWRHAMMSTMPLPATVALCEDVPPDIAGTAASLPWNRVVSVCLKVRGTRPDLGFWRYYADPDIIFTRLVFLHAFDPLMAPPDGWPLLAETCWRADEEIPGDLVDRVIRDAARCGVLLDGEVTGTHLVEANPAYVVFENEGAECIEAVRNWLRDSGIDPGGRYGNWVYSSMSDALTDGLRWGDTVASLVGASR